MRQELYETQDHSGLWLLSAVFAVVMAVLALGVVSVVAGPAPAAVAVTESANVVSLGAAADVYPPAP